MMPNACGITSAPSRGTGSTPSSKARWPFSQFLVGSSSIWRFMDGVMDIYGSLRPRSSIGRAPDSYSGGCEFDPRRGLRPGSTVAMLRSDTPAIAGSIPARGTMVAMRRPPSGVGPNVTTPLARIFLGCNAAAARGRDAFLLQRKRCHCPGFWKDRHCLSRSLGGAGAPGGASHPAGSIPGPSLWPQYRGHWTRVPPSTSYGPGRPVALVQQFLDRNAAITRTKGFPAGCCMRLAASGSCTLGPVFALLAQRLGHRAHNSAITGSNPVQSTTGAWLNGRAPARRAGDCGFDPRRT